MSFFLKLDAELEKPTSIYLIGGAVATIVYKSKSGTADIDTWEQEQAIEIAYKKVLKKHPKLNLPLSPANVHIKSENMKMRFQAFKLSGLKKLKLFTPDPEDLFLLKAQRANEKDIQDLQHLSKLTNIDSKRILNRFLKDILPNNYASDTQITDNYLYAVSSVFGPQVAKNHETQIRHS